jgi:hypothetical protein
MATNKKFLLALNFTLPICKVTKVGCDMIDVRESVGYGIDPTHLAAY